MPNQGLVLRNYYWQKTECKQWTLKGQNQMLYMVNQCYNFSSKDILRKQNHQLSLISIFQRKLEDSQIFPHSAVPACCFPSRLPTRLIIPLLLRLNHPSYHSIDWLTCSTSACVTLAQPCLYAAMITKIMVSEEACVDVGHTPPFYKPAPRA